MHVENIISKVFDGKYLERGLSGLRGLMVHRVGMDLKINPPHVMGHDALTICQAFQGKIPEWVEAARAVGYQNPYSVIIGGDGGPREFNGWIWQCLPLDELGYHARAWSRGYIGIACIGDFRVRPPSRAQRSALLCTLAQLCARFGMNPYKAVKGHGEVPEAHDGSKAPGKPYACPGDLLGMDLLRDDTMQIMKSRAILGLSNTDFQLTQEKN